MYCLIILLPCDFLCLARSFNEVEGGTSFSWTREASYVTAFEPLDWLSRTWELTTPAAHLLHSS